MHSRVTVHQLNQIFNYILANYETFAPIRKNGQIIFDKVENASDIVLSGKKTIIPFKKIIFPNGLEIGDYTSRRIALLGLNNCDTWALQYFLSEFKETALLPLRENMLVVANECLPDRNCFCDLMGTNKAAEFDLFIQENKNSPEIIAGSKAGEGILKKNAVKCAKDNVTIKLPDLKRDPFDKKELSKLVGDRNKFEDFWQKISDNCFGCGACTAVCPLCFCSRQDFKSDLAANERKCLNWDSCFAKRFSEIQNHYDFRPKNTDRLYNWYHHKFVRSYHSSKKFLCTGCGRCIEACPANLNIKNILESIIHQNNERS